MQFKAVERKSNFIPRTLLEFVNTNKIDMKFLDFDLISYETYLKKEGLEKPKLVENVSLAQLKDPSLKIIQSYEIFIIPAIKNENQVSYSLSTNKSKLKAAITIKAGSIFRKSSILAKNIKNEIWKKNYELDF